MTTVADVVAALAEKTRPENAATWDPVGLQLGDPSSAAERIGVCHEVTESVVAAVEESPLDLLVTYHPLLFHPITRLTAGSSAGARAYRLIKAGTAVLVTHTDFDAAPGGSADALAKLLDLKDIQAFGGDPELDRPEIGRHGRFGSTLDALDARLSDAFGYSGLRVSGDGDAHIDRVAVVPGSGASFIDQAAEVAQALVTGDVPHHQCVHAADLGLSIVDPGHIATERPGVEALVELVAVVTGSKVVDLTDHDPRTWA